MAGMSSIRLLVVSGSPPFSSPLFDDLVTIPSLH